MQKYLIKIATYLAGNNQHLPVCYLAGKVTGLDYGEVYAKFKIKEIEMERKGFYVLNPCSFINAQEDWAYAMRISVILLACASVADFQPDWIDSKGARLEHELCIPLEIQTIEIAA